MGKLDSLKITECPYAFASFAAKHNALCDLMAGMVGENGISVVMAEKNAIIRGNTAAGSLGNVSGAMANVVSTDGTLVSVYAGNAIATAFPTHLQTGASAGDRTYMDGGTEIGVTNAGFTEYVALTKNLIYMQGAHYFNIDEAALTQDMEIREIAVCNSGSPASMLVIASAPY